MLMWEFSDCSSTGVIRAELGHNRVSISSNYTSMGIFASLGPRNCVIDKNVWMPMLKLRSLDSDSNLLSPVCSIRVEWMLV